MLAHLIFDIASKYDILDHHYFVDKFLPIIILYSMKEML